jgi:predicted small metal-binding protein
MKQIGCKDVEIDCEWASSGETEDDVLDALSNHAIAEHQVWLEDGPIQMWTVVRAKIRDSGPVAQTGHAAP